MIFDEVGPPDREPSAEAPRRRRRRRRSSSGSSEGSGHRRRRSEGVSARHEAADHDRPMRNRSDANTAAWLFVLGFLIVAALGFAWYLHQERNAPVQLSGDAPSTRIMPFIDPIFAPLETGAGGPGPDTLSPIESGFRAEREKVNLDNQEVYATAATIMQILGEAAADRQRHLERLARIGSPVAGLAADPSARADIGETERKHLEVAVGVSWQRNSMTYRNRVEELWYRLLRLEQGRFRGGSAPQSMAPVVPQNP